MRISIFLALAFGICSAAFCSPPVLRAMLVGDTHDEWIGSSVRADVWRMQKTLEVIARKIGCQIERHRHRSSSNFLVNLISGLIAYCLNPYKPKIGSLAFKN